MTTTPTTTPTTAPTTGTLAVPGATLYYERRGTGPVLLLVPGGGADAGLFAGMAPALAATGRTVVSYDPRGQSRSTLDGPAADQRVADWADDARRILDLVSPGEPADVLGCSAGAVAALGLLARHPERVRRVVAHEPPLVEVLPDPAPHRALFAEVRELTRTQGPAAGMAHMAQGLGGTPSARKPPNCRRRSWRWPRACTPTSRSSWNTSWSRSRPPPPTHPPCAPPPTASYWRPARTPAPSPPSTAPRPASRP